MGDELQNAGNSAFHIVHAGAVEVHVARLGGFAKSIVVGKSTTNAVAVELQCPIFALVGVVASHWRNCGDRYLDREVAVFSVLIPSNTTSLCRWSPSLLLHGLGWRMIWKSRGNEKSVVGISAPGRHCP